MSSCVAKRALDKVFERYNRQVMNNIERANYVECLIATLLGDSWTLTWTTGYEWAPWDLEHDNGTRLEVKQAAARQSWHQCEDFKAKPPRFDIAPRSGYWTRDSKWCDKPGRHADIYVFAWHPETSKRLADQRAPEQWTFYVVRAKCLPPTQRSIGLNFLRCRTTQVESRTLSPAVDHLLERDFNGKRIDA